MVSKIKTKVPTDSSKRLRELGWISKKLRSFLMSAAPDSSISTNDLFNSGYGEFATLACQICFFVTFIYYSVVNTHGNLSRRYLTPVEDGNGGHCENVPLEVSNRYNMDINGSWNNQQSFSLSESVYRMDLKNVKFAKGNESYKEQVQEFERDFRNKSARGADRDFAWNLMFASSYSKTSYDNEGVTSLYVDADARIIYDQDVTAGGFANYQYPCKPANSVFSYDNIKGALVMDVTDIPSLPYYWDECWYVVESYYDLGYDAVRRPPTYNLEVQMTTVTTAMAVNQGLATLDSLTEVVGSNPQYRYYIDDFYAPMDPIICIKPSEHLEAGVIWPYPEDNLCLLQIKNFIALPVMNHMGTYGSDCWTPNQCKCGNGTYDAPGYGCNYMGISVSFIFYPWVNSGYQLGPLNLLIKMMMRAYNLNPSKPDVGLIDLTYPATSMTFYSNYMDTPSNGGIYWPLGYNSVDYVDTCPIYVITPLYYAFIDLCDGYCTILQWSLESQQIDDYNAKLNAGNYLKSNLSCNDAFYHADTFDVMKSTPPADTAQKYLVCRDSALTAIANAISNAFASAGLYTAILTSVLLSLIMYSHNKLNPKDKLKDAEDHRVQSTNAMALVMEQLVERYKFTYHERQDMHSALASVFVVDAAHYAAERNNNTVKIIEDVGDKSNTLGGDEDGYELVVCSDEIVQNTTSDEELGDIKEVVYEVDIERDTSEENKM